MGDIAQNALRYFNCPNVDRSDYPKPHNGQIIRDNVIGFDCSGFVCHVLIESGYRVDYDGGTSGFKNSNAFTKKNADEVLSGDIILFDGHVGIVTEYDPNTYIGKFIHMNGDNKKGGKITISDFVSDIDNYVKKFNRKTPINPSGKLFDYYGTTKPITKFLRINNTRYSAQIDLHLNGGNLQPTLRPLGTNVYRNYVMKKPDTTSNLAKKRKNLPIHKKPQCKNVPNRNGAYNLVKSIWGLPRGGVPDY